MRVAWDKPSSGSHVLNLNILVVQILRVAPGEYIVESSHGQPIGVHPTLATAKMYAEKFARFMLEQTLAKLTEAEINDTSWRQTGTPFGDGPTMEQGIVLQLSRMVGIIVLTVTEDASWYDVRRNILRDDFGNIVRVEEQKVLKPEATRVAQRKALANARDLIMQTLLDLPKPVVDPDDDEEEEVVQHLEAV